MTLENFYVFENIQYQLFKKLKMVLKLFSSQKMGKKILNLFHNLFLIINYVLNIIYKNRGRII